MLGLPFEHKHTCRDFTIDMTKNGAIDTVLNDLWNKCVDKNKEAHFQEITLRFLCASHNKFADRFVGTCSCAHVVRFKNTPHTPRLHVRSAPRVKVLKNIHHSSDWNSVEFHHKMISSRNNKDGKGTLQCNVMAFLSVWSHDGNEVIGKKYKVRFCKKFFDVFFKFVAKHRCLKENGHVVLPFHPQVIAGIRILDTSRAKARRTRTKKRTKKRVTWANQIASTSVEHTVESVLSSKGMNRMLLKLQSSLQSLINR